MSFLMSELDTSQTNLIFTYNLYRTIISKRYTTSVSVMDEKFLTKGSWLNPDQFKSLDDN